MSYVFFLADTDRDISAIHGLMPIFPKFLNLVLCFIIKNIMNSILCLGPSFQELQNSGFTS